MGCDIAQGYYFGRPQPGTDVLADAVDPAAVAALVPQRAWPGGASPISERSEAIAW